MSSPESSELQSYIDQLTEATRSGAVEWKAANPTTYIWDAPTSPKGRIILQRSERNQAVRSKTGGVVGLAKVPVHQLQVIDLNTNAVVMKLDSDDEDLKSRLDILYELIRSGISRKALDFLKEIIPHP